MKSLYLLLNIVSISIPFVYSFHPKLKLYKRFNSIILALLFTMVIFIPWDIIFTNNGIWGFNEKYFIGLKIFNLPLEEWLFFMCIPFACIFTHYALLLYFPKMRLNEVLTKNICKTLILALLILSVLNYDKWYTLINFSLAIIFTVIVYRYNFKLLQNYLTTFLVMLIPFLIVNGILTGSFIEEQVVWYNNAENLNIRIGSIPVEDTIYAYSMILCNLFLTEFFVDKFSIQQI